MSLALQKSGKDTIFEQGKLVFSKKVCNVGNSDSVATGNGTDKAVSRDKRINHTKTKGIHKAKRTSTTVQTYKVSNNFD